MYPSVVRDCAKFRAGMKDLKAHPSFDTKLSSHETSNVSIFALNF